ncbi:MAG TPA: bifunctional UDP-N-acetylglucosamine diphosphorylase/glucosamine-1-phosphate N-acetyltransferase GlmU [bacterium]|nr:bifunctional UDP-N-acetylglucosamine diphosphorylase/glucosamine-1-phosphate N-acetyltransferase GlmU [bacterium]
MKRLAVVVLAAGQGTRMKSERAKVLHPVLGLPMIAYPLAVARALGPERVVVVVGAQADKVKESLQGSGVRFALQKEQKGTAHAVKAALPALRGFAGDVVALYGDSTLLRPETLKQLVRLHRRKKADMTLITADLPDPFGYGRIIRDPNGAILGIVEQKDCTPEQHALTEFNPGIYCYRSDFLKKALPRVRNNNRQKEYYLTDLVEIAVKGGKQVASLKIADAAELMGINTRLELAQAATALRARINQAHCLAGVTIEDPDSAWIEPEVGIGKDTVIERGVRLCGRTTIGPECVIEMNVRIEDSWIRPGARIKAGSVLEECEVGEGTQVGPMAHLRPGSVIGRDARIGNFVETKKARIGNGAKLSHLTYAGDAEIGKNVNIGCGFITCNYDGEKKHKTVIEDDVFVGSDTQTVAPVKIGKGAYIGSGSTITRDVPAGALALTRAPLVIKEGWTQKRKAKKAGKK